MIYYLFLLLLLFLGFTNPTAGSWDLFLSFLLFNYVVFGVLKDKLLVFSINFVSLGFIFLIVGRADFFVLAPFLATALYFFLEKIKLVNLKYLPIILIFLTSSFVNSTELRRMLSRDLPLFTYNNDPGVFLKTYQLIEHGKLYYPSLLLSHEGRFEQMNRPTDIWGLRMPTIFYIWKILPGGSTGIWILFLTLSSFALLGAYLIGTKYLNESLALLSPYLLYPYLHFAARDQMILETEWWAVIFFLIGLAFLSYRRLFWTVVTFSLTVLIRELFLLPVLLIGFSRVFLKRKGLYMALIPLTAFTILFLVHLYSANYYIDAIGSLFRPRVIPFGYLFLQQTLAFASWEYYFYAFKPFYIFFAFAILGCGYVFFKISKMEGIFLVISLLSLPISFLRIGTLPFNDYWGVMFMPQVLIFAPLVLGFFKRRSS